nr:uncharacterized protein CTRU02_12138 [Colletotrichum truncatum]KAF6784927.1 hypothetical protein CTRU02_12138 [Colletotrichum truncatum]
MPRLALHHIAAVALISAGIANLPSLVTAEDLEAEDVPPECAQMCAPIVELTGRCDAMTEQRFGDFGKRWDSHQVSQRTSRNRRYTRKRSAEKGAREKRQESESESDSDSDGEVENSGRPPPVAVAAARQANKECVCGERSFDVVGVLNSCATCIAGNATAIEANEDIKEIIAECGFNGPPPTPSAPATTSAPPVVAPAEPPANTGLTTSLPAMLAPERPSEVTPSASTSSTPPPPPPAIIQTPSGPPVASPTPEVSITPVTVFETPSFRTLPPIVSPNDFPPSRSDVQSDAAARFDGWLFGKVVLVMMAVLLLK